MAVRTPPLRIRCTPNECFSHTYTLPIPKSDVHDCYRNFVKAIDGEATQIVTHYRMRTVLKVIMTAFESVQSGKTVKWQAGIPKNEKHALTARVFYLISSISSIRYWVNSL